MMNPMRINGQLQMIPKPKVTMVNKIPMAMRAMPVRIRERFIVVQKTAYKIRLYMHSFTRNVLTRTILVVFLLR